MTIFERLFWKKFTRHFTKDLKILRFRKLSFFCQNCSFFDHISEFWFFEIYEHPKRVYIWSKWPEEYFYKTGITFWPLFGTKNDIFPIFGLFSLIFQWFRFSLPEAERARQYTQNDGKEHLCPKVNFYCRLNQILEHIWTENDIIGHLRTYVAI